MSDQQFSYRPIHNHSDSGELRREQRQFELEMRERRMRQLMQDVRELSRHRNGVSSLRHKSD